MVQALRRHPGTLGLVTGLGWYLSKHSVGVYGTDPGPGRPAGTDEEGLPPGTVTDEVGGFRWSSPRKRSAPSPSAPPMPMPPVR